VNVYAIVDIGTARTREWVVTDTPMAAVRHYTEWHTWMTTREAAERFIAVEVVNI